MALMTRERNPSLPLYPFTMPDADRELHLKLEPVDDPVLKNYLADHDEHVRLHRAFLHRFPELEGHRCE